MLVTGYDIIFFWVIRMVFSGYEQTGKSPFHHVLIHGLVRDSQGRKMSKSLGNGIDPLEVIDKYGADALRLTLVTGNAPGNDMRFYWEQVEASRNFANKIWNASRFIMMNLPDEELSAGSWTSFAPADRWILSRINTVAREVTENMERYELGIAVQKIHDFLWDEFCDWYIEMVKLRFGDTTEEGRRAKNAALWTLKKVLGDSMKLLHPFMPFITEEIYCTLYPDAETVMTASWPVFGPGALLPGGREADQRLSGACARDPQRPDGDERAGEDEDRSDSRGTGRGRGGFPEADGVAGRYRENGFRPDDHGAGGQDRRRGGRGIGGDQQRDSLYSA